MTEIETLLKLKKMHVSIKKDEIYQIIFSVETKLARSVNNKEKKELWKIKKQLKEKLNNLGETFVEVDWTIV